MREKSHRGSWDPDSQDATRVASQFGFVGAVAASAHCSLIDFFLCWLTYIYTCVWWAGCGYFLFNQTENWDLVSLMCGVEHLAVFIQEMQAVVFVMTVSISIVLCACSCAIWNTNILCTLINSSQLPKLKSIHGLKGSEGNQFWLSKHSKYTQYFASSENLTVSEPTCRLYLIFFFW